MKEHGSKPVGRHKGKSAVEVSSVRHKGSKEDSKTSIHCTGSLSWQVLPDRAVAKAGVLDTVSKTIDHEKAVSKPLGFEKPLNKRNADVVNRFEDKFPCRQYHDNLSRNENKLPQRTGRKEECVVNRHSTIVQSSRSNNGQDVPTPMMSLQDSRKTHQEKIVKDKDVRPVMNRHRSDVQGKPEEVREQFQRRHSRPQEKTKEERDVGLIQSNSKQPQRKRGNQPDRNMEICVKGNDQTQQKIPSFQDIPTEKIDREVQLKFTHLRGARERYEKLTLQLVKSKENRIIKISDEDTSSDEMSLTCHTYDTNEEDQSSECQKRLSEIREIQKPSGRVLAHAQRHQSSINGSYNLHQPPFSSALNQQVPECQQSSHEHETKLMQRQQYLQEKVKSRKMLLGSVIPSDMTFSSDACRNWQSATMLSYRYREEKSYQHMVLSADSGVSMGEGSSASRRNSETETDDQTKDDLPTIIAEIGEIVDRRLPTKCLRCQRTRCEMKDASSQQSHPPSETESRPSSPYTESISSVTINPTEINVMSPPPPNRIHQCRVIRDKNTYGTMFYPVYRMYLERDGRPELLLLTARKRKKCSTSKYLICSGNDELRRKSSSLVGKLRSNLVGTRFHLATYVKEIENHDIDSRPESPLKIDSLLLFYETNFLGTKGPRRMKVFMPEVGKVDEQLNLLDRVRKDSLDGVLTLINKEPEWDRETLSHILYFEGRVTKSSVKNFQLVEPPDKSSVLLQFGKIGRNEFTLDYHPPINAVQAFAIALSSFDGKIACE